MNGKDDAQQGPLSSEALKRDEWRGGSTELKPEDAPGHTLPASESGAAAGDGSGGEKPNRIAGTMLPPD